MLYIEKLIDNRTCYICDCSRKQTPQWYKKHLPDGEVMCQNCYQKFQSDYINGNLDKSSTVGFGFISQRIVAKTLKVPLEYDCNCSINFKYSYDLYDKNRYGKINVKGCQLNNYNHWKFSLKNKFIPDTYIMLGYDCNRKNILHVWITDLVGKLVLDNMSVCITNNVSSGLRRAKPWEVDNEPYNEVYHSMSLDNCSVLRKE